MYGLDVFLEFIPRHQFPGVIHRLFQNSTSQDMLIKDKTFQKHIIDSYSNRSACFITEELNENFYKKIVISLDNAQDPLRFNK